MSSDKPTIEHFEELEYWLSTFTFHTKPLRESIDRDEAKIAELEDKIDELQNDIKNLEEQLEKVEDQYFRLERSLM